MIICGITCYIKLCRICTNKTSSYAIKEFVNVLYIHQSKSQNLWLVLVQFTHKVTGVKIKITAVRFWVSLKVRHWANWADNNFAQLVWGCAVKTSCPPENVNETSECPPQIYLEFKSSCATWLIMKALALRHRSDEGLTLEMSAL